MTGLGLGRAKSKLKGGNTRRAPAWLSIAGARKGLRWDVLAGVVVGLMALALRFSWFGEVGAIACVVGLMVVGVAGGTQTLIAAAAWWRTDAAKSGAESEREDRDVHPDRLGYSTLPDVTDVFEDLCLVLVNTPLGDPAEPGCRWGLPALFWGEPAVGKSERIRAAAARAGMRCEVLYPGQEAPDSFSTVPIPNREEEGGLIYAAALGVIAELAKAKSAVLFIDEVSCASLPVQAALLALILDRRCGSLELPPGIRVLGAANPPDVAAIGQDLPAPSASRLLHFQITAGTPTEFAAHRRGLQSKGPRAGRDSGAEQRVRDGWEALLPRAESRVHAFLAAKPELLHRLPHDGGGGRGLAWPNKRGWTYVIHGLATLDCLGLGEREELERLLVAGSVGTDAAETWSRWQAPRRSARFGGSAPGGSSQTRDPSSGGAPTEGAGSRHAQSDPQTNAGKTRDGAPAGAPEPPSAEAPVESADRPSDSRMNSRSTPSAPREGARATGKDSARSPQRAPGAGEGTADGKNGSSERKSSEAAAAAADTAAERGAKRSLSEPLAPNDGEGTEPAPRAPMEPASPCAGAHVQPRPAQPASQGGWQRTLQSIIGAAGAATSGAQQTSLRRPSRRALAAGRLAPGPVARLPVVALIVDTSPSMPDAVICRARTEALAVLGRLGVNTAWWLEAAGGVTLGPSLLSTSRIARAPLVRGEDTDFGPACALLPKLHPRPDVAVYLTDGDGPAPEAAPGDMRFVWALFGAGECPALWGAVVRL